MIHSKYNTISLIEFNATKHYIFYRNDAIGEHINRNKCWEPHLTELLHGYLKEGYNCLDVGANFGYHSITMAILNGKTGKVFCFEPMMEFCNLISSNSYLNNLDNIKVYNNAVGKTKDVVYVPQPNFQTDYPINHGDTSISKMKIGNNVDMIKIDDLDLPKINFIKIDVQGCELDVLMGSKNKIIEDKPLLIVEIEDSQVSKFNNTANDIIEYIQKELEYDLYQMMTDWPSDFLCVPKNSKINTEFKTFYLKPIFTEMDRTPI
jgi:FkbM family methyltransferase